MTSVAFGRPCLVTLTSPLRNSVEPEHLTGTSLAGGGGLRGGGHPLVLPQRSFPLLAPPSAVRRGAAPGTGWLQAGPHLCCGPPTQAPGITGVSGYFPLFINFSFSAIIKILIM